MDTSAEHALLDVARRAQRNGAGRGALVLHLSRLHPPAPRPHHLRVVRALLQDIAQRHDGGLFPMRNGDLVLVATRAALEAPGTRFVSAGETLPERLVRMLSLEAKDPGMLVSVWSFEQEPERLLTYATERLADVRPALPPQADQDLRPGTVDSMAALAERTAITDLVRRQTGILLTTTASGGGRIQPIYHEAIFAMALLAHQAVSGPIDVDPFLFQDLATHLDGRMLRGLLTELGGGGPLDAARRPSLHINLTLNGILSGRFARLAEAAAGLPIGVEVALMDAAADTEAFAAARAVVAAAEMTLALDRVSHLAVMLACPQSLGADLIKLDWSARLLDQPDEMRVQLRESLGQIGVERIVLQRVDSEAALQWGMGRGIRRFQGHYIDAMLAARRMGACSGRGACTLRQCTERAAATAASWRSQCTNQTLLDAGAPP